MRLIKLRGMRRVNGLHFSPDGRRLLAVGGYEVRSCDDAAWIDTAKGEETLRVRLHAINYAVSANLTKIAVGDVQPDEFADERIPLAVFDPANVDWPHCDYQTVLPAARSVTDVFALAFSPDGKKLAVSYYREGRGGYRTAFRTAVFPLGRGKPVEVTELDPDEFTVSSFAYSPNGKLLACDGGEEGEPTVKVLNARTLAPIRRIFLKGSRIRQSLYSPDGGTLAVALVKSVVCVPANSDEPRHTLSHPKQVNAIAFTPDGRRLLSTCTDQLLRIWDTATGQLVTSFNWNIGQINPVVVSPDGLTAAVGGQKGQVAVFDLDG